MSTTVNTKYAPADRERVSPTRWRRTLVVVMYLGYPLGAVIWKLGAERDDLVLWAAGAGLVTLAFATAALLFGAHRQYWQWGNAPERELDERQVTVRNRAYVTAYAAFVTLTFLALMYGAVAIDKAWWLPTTWGEASAVVWGALLLGTTLPAAILAWTDRPLAE